MEPNKMDNQFREQLNEREIQPSDAAWDRLDAMLSIAEKKKRKVSWIYIAASVLGFLLIGTTYFNGFETVEINKGTPLVLEQKKDRDNLEESEISNEDVSLGRIQKKSIESHKVIADNKNLQKKPKQIQNKEKEILIINQKTEKQSIKSQSDSATVDELLAAVENSSKKESQFDRNPSIQVNAAQLLSQVDGELELSFREKVINRVSKNYHTVKVALANRNLE